MNHEEFIKVLKENKILKDYNETIEQKFPAIKYYLKNYGPSITVNGQIFNFKLIDITPISNIHDWRAMNRAFAMLVELNKQGAFNKK